MKRCPRCRLTKDSAEFPRNRASKDGHASYCKPCHIEKSKETADRLYGGHRNFLLKLRYGITEAQEQAIIAAQRGRCAICGKKGAGHIDHSRATGEVRGVLCFHCNRGLGKFEDNINLIRLAIRYLERHRRWRVKAPFMHPAQGVLFIPPTPDDGV